MFCKSSGAKLSVLDTVCICVYVVVHFICFRVLGHIALLSDQGHSVLRLTASIGTTVGNCLAFSIHNHSVIKWNAVMTADN